MGGLSAGGQDSWPLHGNRETGKFPVHELRSLHRIFFHGNRAEFPEQIMAREQRRLRKHRHLRGKWRDGQYRVRCGCRKLIRIRAAHCRSWRIRWPAEFRVLLVPVRAVTVQPAREFCLIRSTGGSIHLVGGAATPANGNDGGLNVNSGVQLYLCATTSPCTLSAEHFNFNANNGSSNNNSALVCSVACN